LDGGAWRPTGAALEHKLLIEEAARSAGLSLCSWVRMVPVEGGSAGSPERAMTKLECQQHTAAAIAAIKCLARVEPGMFPGPGLYVIRAGADRFVKIDFTVSLAGRLADLQSGNHRELRTLAFIETDHGAAAPRSGPSIRPSTTTAAPTVRVRPLGHSGRRRAEGAPREAA
jgi:hypothetical protein